MRSSVIGWSSSAIRRNLKFLYSVDETSLDGQGFALTLTVKDCPPDPEAWRAIREAFFFRQRRRGMLRCHWVTEWQRRGVPHLHLAIWFPQGGPKDCPSVPDRFLPLVVLADWLELTADFGSRRRGQHVSPIWDVLGWNQYVSKHAARGLHHYQRSPENVPESWRTGTGRMWGYLGAWTLQEPLRVDLSPEGFHCYRRMVRGWRRANARLSGDPRRIRSARGMLRCPVRELSAVRGVSEWIGEALNLRMLEGLRQSGYELLSV